MKKKFKYAIITLVAIGIWVFIIAICSGCQQHYCPTYSLTPTQRLTRVDSIEVCNIPDQERAGSPLFVGASNSVSE
jgi:hypothetical protein